MQLGHDDGHRCRLAHKLPSRGWNPEAQRGSSRIGEAGREGRAGHLDWAGAAANGDRWRSVSELAGEASGATNNSISLVRVWCGK